MTGHLSLAALRWLAVAVVALGMGALLYAILSAPSRPAARLGIRGLKRQRALQDGTWNKIEPSIRWLGDRISGSLSQKQFDSLDAQLRSAGDYLGLTPPEYIALSVLSTFAGLAAGLVGNQVGKTGPVIVLACTLFGGACPYLVISGEATRRMKWISRRLPAAVDLIALGMSAGLDFPGAIRQVVEKASDPYDALIEELGWILHKLGLGSTRRQALEEFAARVPIEVVTEFVGSVCQAEERGHPVARVLQVQATTSRERRSVRAEESAAKAGVALTAPLILLFLAILLLIMAPMIMRLSHSAVVES